MNTGAALSRSTCLHPCGQEEQLARSPAVILRGLSDRAVTTRRLFLDIHTRASTHPVLTGSAWPVERRAGECSQQVEKSRRLDGRGVPGLYLQEGGRLKPTVTHAPLTEPGNTNKVRNAEPCQAGSQTHVTSIQQLPSKQPDRQYRSLKLGLFDAPSCVLFLSSPTQGGRKTQRERQPEKGAGDRLDGREKAESSAGTRRVKDQQQGAEGPGEEVVFWMDQKIPFMKGTPSPPHFKVPLTKRQRLLKLLILIFKEASGELDLLNLLKCAALLLLTDDELPANSSQMQTDTPRRHMTQQIYSNQ